MNPIALKIKDARIKANMSEKDLAKKCGVAPSYIIQIESGKKIINEVTAEKILAVFGQKVGFDFGDQEEEEKPVEKKPEKKKEVAPVYYDVVPFANGQESIFSKKKKTWNMNSSKIKHFSING